MIQIMEECGKVKRVRIKVGRYGYQQQRAMICFSNEKKAAVAIKETNKYNRWKAEEYKNTLQITKNIKNINLMKNNDKTTVKQITTN